jgi:hypothetical protein
MNARPSSLRAFDMENDGRLFRHLDVNPFPPIVLATDSSEPRRLVLSIGTYKKQSR